MASFYSEYEPMTIEMGVSRPVWSPVNGRNPREWVPWYNNVHSATDRPWEID